jgi:predicted metal-dependent phosphoesterase TrpH
MVPPLPPPEIPLALPTGWVRIDCHLHTAVSGDATTTIDELAERVEQCRLDVVCVTDHHHISAAHKAIERGVGARVIVGEEIRTPVGELIGLFLTERIPYVLPVAEVVGRIRRQQAVVYAPHPFDPVRAGLGRNLDRLCAEGSIDVIEAFNAKTAADEYNEQAARAATHYELPCAAGSDAHDPAGIGAAYVEMPDFDGPEDFVAKLHSARIVGEFRDYAPLYRNR